MIKKETLITFITFAILICAIAAGIFFVVRMIQDPDGDRNASGIMSGELKTYTHSDYGFSLHYPADFKLGNFKEGEGDVILFQDSRLGSEASKSRGFQIFISLYDEPEELSEAVIKKATEGRKTEKLANISVGRDKLKAFSFEMGEGGQKTREIWLVENKNLYQFTSFLEFGEEMEEVIKSLRFD